MTQGKIESQRLIQSCFSNNGLQAFSQRAVRVSYGYPITDFGYPDIHIFLCIMQWDEKVQFPQICIFGHPSLKSWLKALIGPEVFSNNNSLKSWYA